MIPEQIRGLPLLTAVFIHSELLTETTGVVAHTLAREGDPLLPITRESTEKKAAEQKRKDKVYILPKPRLSFRLTLSDTLCLCRLQSTSILLSMSSFC
jgi:hypothetical protein